MFECLYIYLFIYYDLFVLCERVNNFTSLFS